MVPYAAFGRQSIGHICISRLDSNDSSHTVCFGFLFDECVNPRMMQRELILQGIWQWKANSVVSMLTAFSAMLSEKGHCCPRWLYLSYKNITSAKG